MLRRIFQNIFGQKGFVPLTADLSKVPFNISQKMKFYDPWLVGGAARYVVGLTAEAPKDYDLVISNKEDESHFLKDVANEIFGTWGDSIDSDSGYVFEAWPLKTSMGGHRIEMGEDLIMDIWFDDIPTYLAEVPTVWDALAIRLNTGAVIVSGELAQETRNRLIEDRQTRRHKNKNRFLEHLDNQGLAKEYLSRPKDQDD